jgi:hypothetical protein
MMETVEYFGKILKTYKSQPLDGKRVDWKAEETVIIRETKGLSFYRIMKLHDREIGVVTGSKVFKYYDPEWLEIRGK